MEYQLEKTVWMEADFEGMGWHDATFHAVANLSDQSELLFDLDYIFQWVCPVPPNQYFSFQVAPVTLIFKNVFDLKISIDLGSYCEIEVADLHRSEPRPWPNGEGTNWSWRMELHQGEITFTASGYEQFVRRAPRLTQLQQLKFEERGGLSFDREFKG